MIRQKTFGNYHATVESPLPAPIIIASELLHNICNNELQIRYQDCAELNKINTTLILYIRS